MKNRKILSIILVFVMLLTLVPTQFFALASSSPYTGTGFELQYKVTSKWSGAQNIQMTLKNTSSALMNNWAVGFTASGSAESPWSCAIGAGSEGYCLVENAGWNNKIPAGSSVTFGFTLKTDEPFNPDVFYIGDEARNPPTKPTDPPVDPDDPIVDPDDPIVVPDDPSIDWDNLDVNDDDGDGLVNGLEDYFGTDKNNPDTDGDELPDGYEVLTLGSDPLTPDGDLDFDEDGLSNLEEYQLGTDPLNPDADEDGLSDYDEIYIYSTDPLNSDSDDDTIWDGDEIELGLDPLNPITDGTTLDKDRVFIRDISEDVFDSSVFEDNSAIPSITLHSKGLPEKQITVEETVNPTLLTNPSIMGKSIDIHLSDLVEGGTIAFEMEESQPLNELMICRFDSDSIDLSPLETTLDENGSFTAELDGSGSYFVMDVKEFLDYLEFDINEYVDTQPINLASAPTGFSRSSLGDLESEVEELIFASIDAETGETTVYTAEQLQEMAENDAPTASLSMGITPFSIDGPPAVIIPTVDVIFLVDTTQSMMPQKDRILQKIGATIDKLESDSSINVKFAVAEYGGSNESDVSIWHYGGNPFVSGASAKNILNNHLRWGIITNDFGRPVFALNWLLGYFRHEGRTPAADCHVVIVTDSDFRTDKSYNFQTVMDNYVANNVACSAVWPPNPTPPVSDYVPSLDGLPKWDADIARTGGKTFDVTADFEISLAAHLKKPIDRSGKETYITLKGLARVKLDSIPDNTDYITDTDKDGLPDRDELIFPSATTNIYAWAKHYYAATPLYVNQLKFISEIRIAVYGYTSNPTLKDSDGDGYLDGSNDLNGDGKINDPQPLVSDVTTYKLGNSEKFIDIQENTTSYYGGNQGWMEDSVLVKGGCGIAAACDVLAYAKMTGRFSGELYELGDIHNITKVQYTEYMTYMGQNHMKPRQVWEWISNGTGTWGIWASDYIKGFNGFSDVIKASKKSPTEEQISTIIDSIEDDKPVTLLYGPYSSVRLYGEPYDGEIFEKGKGEDKDKNKSAHYVNITEIVIDDVMNETYFVVASWGSRYILNWGDYSADPGLGSAILFYDF